MASPFPPSTVSGSGASSVTDFLSRDHRLCDELLAAVEDGVGKGDWERAVRRFQDFRKALEHHLDMEEKVLFPAFEAATGMDHGPTFVMRGEHEQMRELMAELAEAAEAKDADGFLGRSETLNVLVQQHNMKEEQMLYPMADDALGVESAEVLDGMRRLPQ
jgi:hemerythrin-like domain-containing protein